MFGSSAEDFNGDSILDWIIGAPGSTANPGYVAVRDGASGGIILPGSPNTAYPQFGHGVAALGNVVGSPQGDYFIGRGISATGSIADSIVCSGSDRAQVSSVLQGRTCVAGSLPPVLTAGGQPGIGTAVAFTITDPSNPNATGVFVVGQPPAQPQTCVGVVPGVVQGYGLVAGSAMTLPIRSPTIPRCWATSCGRSSRWPRRAAPPTRTRSSSRSGSDANQGARRLD